MAKSASPLTQANNYLALQLHRLLSKGDDNVFFSPFSISVAMGMLLCAAEKETASELRTALGHEQSGIKKDDVATVFEQQLTLLLQPNDSHSLSCENAMLRRMDLEVKNEYKNIVSKYFKAEIFEFDLQKGNEKIANQINEWVTEKTNNMISELSVKLSKNSALILLNAVYFKGMWKNKFEKEETIPMTFYNRGVVLNAKEAEMMQITKLFPFYEDKELKILQLPYTKEEMAMMIILPREIDGLKKVEKDLSAFFIQDFKKNLRETTVEIAIPRLQLEYETSLVSFFQELGVQRVFKDGAQLTIASDSPELFVSEISHKAVLEINEEGTEAAAVTDIDVCDGPGPAIYQPQFLVDHPFLFVIYNTESGLILFMGRVNEL